MPKSVPSGAAVKKRSELLTEDTPVLGVSVKAWHRFFVGKLQTSLDIQKAQFDQGKRDTDGKTTA
jgi:hypothetical protein